MGSFKHYRDIVLVVLLLALPFFFLRSSIRRPEDTNWLDRALLHVAAPFQYFAALLARGVSGLVGDYVYLVDVKADNNRLAYENANLRGKVSELERTDADNRRLRRLLGLRDTIGQELVSAVVVGKDTTEYFRVAQLTVAEDFAGDPLSAACSCSIVSEVGSLAAAGLARTSAGRTRAKHRRPSRCRRGDT